MRICIICDILSSIEELEGQLMALYRHLRYAKGSGESVKTAFQA
jgi:hypothetical protein